MDWLERRAQLMEDRQRERCIDFPPADPDQIEAEARVTAAILALRADSETYSV